MPGCVKTRKIQPGNNDAYDNDPKGNYVLCDGTAPYYEPLNFTPGTLIYGTAKPPAIEPKNEAKNDARISEQLVADVANDSAALVGLLGLSCCSVHVRCHGSEAHERFGLMPRFGASLAPTQIPVQVVQKSPLALERSTQQVLRDEPSVCLGSQSGIHKCLVAKR